MEQRSRRWVISEFIAKFHYTGPTGPDPTRKKIRGTRVSEKVRWVPDKVRGLCLVGSGRVRSDPSIVEFSY